MANNSWQVELEAIIDKSQISEELKHLSTEKLTVDTNLDLTNFSNGVTTMRDLIKQVETEMKRVLSFEGIKFDNKEVSRWATEYVNEWKKATTQVENDIDKTLQSLNNFSFKNSGFEEFSMEIGNAQVSVKELTKELENMKITGDITGLDTIKNEIEMLEKEFTNFRRETDQLTASLNNFSLKNAGFENFSSEINGAEKSVAQLRQELNNLSASGNVAGLSQIKAQIEILEKEFTELCKETDKAKESLNNFSINNAGFDQFETEINGAKVSVQELKQELDNMKVTADFSGLDNVKSQINTLKEEFTQIQNIQINIETGSYEAQVQSVISKTQQWIDINGEATISTSKLSAALKELEAANTAYSAEKSAANTQRLVQAENQLQIELTKVRNEVTLTNAEFAKTSQVQALLQRVTDWVDKNGAAMNKWGVELRNMMAELSSGVEMPISRLKELEVEFKQIGTAAREAGNLGQSFGEKITSAMSKFSYWTSVTMIIMQSINAIRTAIDTVVDLDSALVDLQKTTSMTADELEDFYYAANDTAIQMGVTTEEIIDQAAAWSRLGYSSQEAATQMAALSSEFASISPGMDTETAQEGLVSVMKAFDIEVDDVLDGIMSKINIVGNTAATTNEGIIEMLERSSSAMSEANNTLEETIALETAA